ncbi:MAG: hypothetical protein QOG50_2643, partial [Actinomycetota bacterium]|nr:hypothetical protein [Actinomycetota bacterium]
TTRGAMPPCVNRLLARRPPAPKRSRRFDTCSIPSPSLRASMPLSGFPAMTSPQTLAACRRQPEVARAEREREKTQQKLQILLCNQIAPCRGCQYDCAIKRGQPAHSDSRAFISLSFRVHALPVRRRGHTSRDRFSQIDSFSVVQIKPREPRDRVTRPRRGTAGSTVLDTSRSSRQGTSPANVARKEHAYL